MLGRRSRPFSSTRIGRRLPGLVAVVVGLWANAPGAATTPTPAAVAALWQREFTSIDGHGSLASLRVGTSDRALYRAQARERMRHLAWRLHGRPGEQGANDFVVVTTTSPCIAAGICLEPLVRIEEVLAAQLVVDAERRQAVRRATAHGEARLRALTALTHHVAVNERSRRLGDHVPFAGHVVAGRKRRLQHLVSPEQAVEEAFAGEQCRGVEPGFATRPAFDIGRTRRTDPVRADAG